MTFETIIDGLMAKANELSIELVVEDTFDEDDPRFGQSVIVQNLDTMKFGIVSVNVKEFPDEPICFFEFNDKLYQYAIAEGFEKGRMLESFDNDILKKLTKKEFVEFILT